MFPGALAEGAAGPDRDERVRRPHGGRGRPRGGFRLLDVRPADGRHRARFRLSLADTSVDYYDAVLARFPTGRVGIEEVVRLEDGDRLTDEIRRKILPAAALQDPGLDARLGDADRLDLAHSTQLADLGRAYGDGRWKDARRLHEALPAGLRDRKPARFRHAQALVLGRGTRADQEAAVAVCRGQYPDDPATHLLALTFHMQRREYGAAREALTALRGSIGADAMLDVIEALILARTGQPRAGAAAAERAATADPELRAAYFARIAVAIDAGDHAATLEWMKRATVRTGLRFENLRQKPACAAFVRSPQYQEWVSWQARRGGDR